MGQKGCKCIYKQETSNLNLMMARNRNNHVNQNSFHLLPNQSAYYLANVFKIIKIQSLVRGILTRNKYKTELKKILRGTEASPQKRMRQIDVIQDYSNLYTKKTEQILGPFLYDQPNSSDQPELNDKGPYELDNCSIYLGQWNNKNQRHGKGIQFWIDGSKYEGYWKNDMTNGKGRLIYGDGEAYEGEWINDKAEGKGKYINTQGSIYFGEWKDDMPHGRGEEKWIDGSVYIGYYENGKKHGKAKFNWTDGSYYEGEFFNNEINGFGKYVWSDGRSYEGFWKNNKMNGKGTFIWPNGKKYIGEYQDDEKNGFGEFILEDGVKYIGTWKNGLQHGKGALISKVIGKKEMEFNAGKIVDPPKITEALSANATQL